MGLRTTAMTCIAPFARARQRVAFVLLALLGGLVMPPTQAMTLVVQNDQVFATGPVTDDDYVKFKNALATPGLKAVVLVNSTGGDLWTGLAVSRLIRSQSLHTIVAGWCASACSIMAIGGVERFFSNAFPASLNQIGVHGAHDKLTKRVNPMMQPQIYAHYKLMLGERFKESVFQNALYNMSDSDAMMRVYESARNPRAEIWQCPSGQSPRSACHHIAGETALSLGLITQETLIPLNLPDEMQLRQTWLGVGLVNDESSIEQAMQSLAQAHCDSAACTELLVNRMHAASLHKAVAFAIEGSGFGYSYGASTSQAAGLRAIRECNLRRNRPPTLCDLKWINQSSIEPLVQLAIEQSKQAMQVLKPPTEAHHAEEEFGRGDPVRDTLRTVKLTELTPLSIDGVTTLSTQALVQRLLSENPPVLVDVHGAFQTLPGARVLLNGGFASETDQLTQAVQTRYQALLPLLAPDRRQPVVFFGEGRESWQAVNAAVRARRLGYEQVFWYRGGVAAWRAAALPTALTRVQAVAH